MPIFKAKCTAIPVEMIRNKTLSLGARGLFSFILSLPDSQEVNESWLLEQADGYVIDDINGMLIELEEQGYLSVY